MWKIDYTTMLIVRSILRGHQAASGNGRGEVIGFWLAVGPGVSFMAGTFYVVAGGATPAITHMDFASSYSHAIIASEKPKDASAKAVAKTYRRNRRFKSQNSHPMYRLPMTFAEIFPVGVLVSLDSAGISRNSRFLPAHRD